MTPDIENEIEPETDLSGRDLPADSKSTQGFVLELLVELGARRSEVFRDLDAISGSNASRIHACS
jgi:hypothetical protein